MAGKVFEGFVVSNKMQKTVVVAVSRRYKEERTGKIMSTRTKYKVHCEDPKVKSGDLVSFTECRPISAQKRFRLLKLLKQSDVIMESKADEVLEGVVKS